MSLRALIPRAILMLFWVITYDFTKHLKSIEHSKCPTGQYSIYRMWFNIGNPWGCISIESCLFWVGPCVPGSFFRYLLNGYIHAQVGKWKGQEKRDVPLFLRYLDHFQAQFGPKSELFLTLETLLNNFGPRHQKTQGKRVVPGRIFMFFYQ